MLENNADTRARESTLYKEAKLRRLKRRIEMEESFLWSMWECTQEYRAKQWPGPWKLMWGPYGTQGPTPDRELESGKLSIGLKCDDDIQCSMSALYVISPDGHLWWLCWKLKIENVSQLRSVSVLKVQDIGFNIKDKMFVAWKLVRYESKQKISAHE